MTTHTCDACGSDVSHLTLLQDQYKTPAIQEICHDCERHLQKMLTKWIEDDNKKRQKAS